MSFDVSMESKCRDGFAQSCHLLMCLENHQPPVLSATLQVLLHFSEDPIIICHFLKESFVFRQEFFLVGVGEV